MKVLAIILIVIVVLAILYFLMIMPRMAHKPDTACFKEWLYAHRGLHDNATQAPENSMAAFRKAVDAGFGIELDIQLTKDKIPVVFHDFTLKRVCGGEGKICDYTYEELQQFHLCESTEKIPKFEDVLQMVDGKAPLIVEFKIERTDLSLCPIADKMLRAYKGMYCMESFNPLGVQWYRKNHPELVRGQLSDAFLKEGEYVGVLYFVLQNLLLNFVTKPDLWHTITIIPRFCQESFAEACIIIPQQPGLLRASRSWTKRESISIFSFLTASCRRQESRGK